MTAGTAATALTSLTGRRIVVCGAAGPLGRVAVAASQDAGAEVVAVGRDAARLADAASAGADVRVVDLADPAAAERLGQEFAGQGVDAVWQLVGGWRGGTPFEEQPLADWDALHDGLVRTTIHVARSFTAPLLASPHGRFLTVSSPQATRPTSTNAAYAAAKAAADAVVLALADRFAGSAATANVVVVPAILTPAMRAKAPDRERPGFVAAEEVAATLVHLTSDAGRPMNGQRVRLTLAGA